MKIDNHKALKDAFDILYKARGLDHFKGMVKSLSEDDSLDKIELIEIYGDLESAALLCIANMYGEFSVYFIIYPDGSTAITCKFNDRVVDRFTPFWGEAIITAFAGWIVGNLPESKTVRCIH